MKLLTIKEVADILNEPSIKILRFICIMEKNKEMETYRYNSLTFVAEKDISSIKNYINKIKNKNNNINKDSIFEIDKYYTSNDLAKLLKITNNGAVRLMRKGAIKAIKTGNYNAAKYVIPEEEFKRIEEKFKGYFPLELLTRKLKVTYGYLLEFCRMKNIPLIQLQPYCSKYAREEDLRKHFNF